LRIETSPIGFKKTGHSNSPTATLVSACGTRYNGSFLMHKLLSSNRLIGVCGSLAVAALFSILAGCGDTFRPIVVPSPQPGVDPGTQRTAVVLTQMPAGFTGTCAGNTPPPCPGVMMQINVGGPCLPAPSLRSLPSPQIPLRRTMTWLS
jgi:hypothetical protein